MVWYGVFIFESYYIFSGPMVYGICYCPISFMEQLKELGFAGLPYTDLNSLFEILNWEFLSQRKKKYFFIFSEFCVDFTP